MQDHTELIHNRWLQDNYRMGALGIIVRDYLAAFPTTLQEYELFIDSWQLPASFQSISGATDVFAMDWYLPSLVENLLDWSYEEEHFYHNMLRSRHQERWRSLFPHAFSRMPKFDLAAAFRWEPLAKHWPDDVRKMLYTQYDAMASKSFVSVELNCASLRQMNLLRLATCLEAAHYDANETAQGKPWNAVWALLQHDDWRHQNDTYFKLLCDKWIRYASMQHLPTYIEQANTLLRNSTIQWHIPFLDNFVCRLRNTDSNTVLLLMSWDALRAQQSTKEKKIPWDYILNRWTDWDSTALLQLLSDHAQWQQDLQRLVLEHPDYDLHIKRELFIYRCENNLIEPRDIEICKTLPPQLQHILMFWLVHSRPSLKKEDVKMFQSRYQWHPVFEQDNIMAQYLPGFAGIRTALHAMNIPWRQALAYAEEAKKSTEDVNACVRKDFQLEFSSDLFDGQV